MDIYKIPLSRKSDMEKVLGMDQVFRLSITIKDSSLFGETGFQYLILEGLEDRLKVARGELSKISEKMDETQKKKIEETIEKERKDVNESFGSIFG